METIQILVIGRHPEIMTTILRLINNQQGWTGVAALTNADALTAFQMHVFDVVLMGAGIPEEENKDLCLFFNAHRPGTPVIQHYGGGSGLLYAEVYQALAAKNK